MRLGWQVPQGYGCILMFCSTRPWLPCTLRRLLIRLLFGLIIPLTSSILKTGRYVGSRPGKILWNSTCALTHIWSKSSSRSASVSSMIIRIYPAASSDERFRAMDSIKGLATCRTTSILCSPPVRAIIEGKSYRFELKGRLASTRMAEMRETKDNPATSSFALVELRAGVSL